MLFAKLIAGSRAPNLGSEVHVPPSSLQSMLSGGQHRDECLTGPPSQSLSVVRGFHGVRVQRVPQAIGKSLRQRRP